MMIKRPNEMLSNYSADDGVTPYDFALWLSKVISFLDMSLK